MSAAGSCPDGETLLGRCLRAVRSLPRTDAGVSDLRPRDFFGSPFRSAGIQAPWLEVFLDDSVASRPFPPLEGGVPDASNPFELLDWEEIARLRQSGTHRIPHHLLVFLELLRCIASPVTCAEGERLFRGVCRPEVLPKEYFREDPEVAGGYLRATYALRRSFFLLYGHLLLCRLAERNESLVRVVFDTIDSDERMKRLHKVLQRPEGVNEKRWKALRTSAVLFIGSQTYRQSLMGARNRNGLPQPTAHGTGKPTKLYRDFYEEEFSAAEEIALPEPMLLILHITLDDRSDAPTLPLFPRSLRPSAHILCDEHRVARFERMLLDDAPWAPVRFTKRELWNGTTQPSSLYVNQAAFCIALEYLLGQDLALAQRLVDIPPEDVKVHNIDGPDGIDDPGLARQISSLGAEIAWDRQARAPRAASRLLAGEQESGFEFSRDGVATLTYRHAEGISRPLTCSVQCGSSGPVPAGTIFVPIPRHLVNDRLRVEFHVFRFEPGQDGESAWTMTPAAASSTDHFTVEDGILLCIELDSSGDSTRSGAFSNGTFLTRSSMRMIGTADEGAGARLCCVIACIE